MRAKAEVAMSTACAPPNEKTADHSEGEWGERRRLKASQRSLGWMWRERRDRDFWLGKGHSVF